jgi:predicted  nucleic acid-binding Zn-ribbon protein
MKVSIDLDLITQEMDALKDDRARLKFELNNIEKEIEKRELQLISLLSQADVKSMDYGVYSFGLKESTRTAFDQRLFKEEQPEMFAKYYVPKVTEKFEFKINK